MIRRRITILAMLLTAILPCAAQRKVTPVETDDKKPQAPTLHYYDKHGKPLDEPVLFLATLDTVDTRKTSPKPAYPRISEFNAGINFFDGILALARSRYGGADVWASLGMWNWLFPTLEIGVGAADKTPEGNNYSYKGDPSVYFKIGADYNFLYKSNPDYQLFAGLRLGFSSFGYSLRDVSVENGYWGETQNMDFRSLRGNALYGEALLGLKVRMWRNISMGWSVRYRFMFSCPPARVDAAEVAGAPFGAEITPWYVPGFGPRTSHLGFSFSVIYTLPFYSRAAAPDASPEP